MLHFGGVMNVHFSVEIKELRFVDAVTLLFGCFCFLNSC